MWFFHDAKSLIIFKIMPQSKLLTTVQYKMKKPIVLIGMMGVGKSRIGFELSKKLDIPLLDSDKEVEQAARYSIAEIFDIYGEEAFRDAERRVIRRLVEEEGGARVIATGGGAILNDETRQRLHDSAYTIWLTADIETLVERTSRTDKRPLLQNGNPAEILSNLMDARKSKYEEAARKIVKVDEVTLAKTVTLVLQAIYDCIEEDEQNA
jgi:shikimate kinase